MAGEGWNRDDFDDSGEDDWIAEERAPMPANPAEKWYEADPVLRRAWLRWYDEVGE